MRNPSVSTTSAGPMATPAETGMPRLISMPSCSRAEDESPEKIPQQRAKSDNEMIRFAKWGHEAASRACLAQRPMQRRHRVAVVALDIEAFPPVGDGAHEDRLPR